MKIEKVNDNQIRCTLTREDLANRELKISELAYGTEKAKNLFRDMMQQASFECGFEAEDIPLMIEAIPLNSECIVLIITKVEDPDELDTRFSKFAPSIRDEEDDEDMDDMINELADGADDVLDLFKKLHENRLKDSSKEQDTSLVSSDTADTSDKVLTRIYSFSSLHQVTRAAKLLEHVYDGENSLYKDETSGKYLLVISQSGCSAESFIKICNLLSEHGSTCKSLPSSQSYLEEHFTVITAHRALQSLVLIY